MNAKAMLWLAAIVLFAGVTPALAQTQQQWTIVAATESSPAAAPVDYDANGNPINCTGENPDSTASGACYNPLVVTFDLNAPQTTLYSSTNAATLTDPTGLNLLSLTNYVGSTDGGVTSISVSLLCTGLCGLLDELDTYTVTVTNEDGSTFTFTAAASADPMEATFTSVGGSSNSDTGTALMYRDSAPVPNATYSGAFENTNTDSINITFAGDQANFSLHPVTIAPVGSSNVCFTNSFSSADPLAMTYAGGYDGIVSGDLMAFDVGDGNGNVIQMLVTPDTSASGVFSDPDDTAGTEYVTMYVLASTNSGCPAWLYAHDAPFHRSSSRIKRPPTRFWNLTRMDKHSQPAENRSAIQKQSPPVWFSNF